MEGTETRAGGSTESCTTTGSFADHEIEDGSVLVQRTYYRLAAGDRTEYAPTESFYDALESAFVWAYLGTAGGSGISAHVEAAVDDALAHTAAEFEGQDDADLRTEVVPAFYQHLAAFHCAYRDP